MISKEQVTEVVEEALSDKECFLVDVTIKPGNIIVVEIDHEKGVEIDDCVALNRFIESRFDREVEDYELEVGSAGITSPYKILRQYQMNEGNEVEVLSKEGKKYSGTLSNVTSETFDVVCEVRKKVEGSKRKQLVEEVVSFKYEEIKYCKNLIIFK